MIIRGRYLSTLGNGSHRATYPIGDSGFIIFSYLMFKRSCIFRTKYRTTKEQAHWRKLIPVHLLPYRTLTFTLTLSVQQSPSLSPHTHAHNSLTARDQPTSGLISSHLISVSKPRKCDRSIGGQKERQGQGKGSVRRAAVIHPIPHGYLVWCVSMSLSHSPLSSLVLTRAMSVWLHPIQSAS